MKINGNNLKKILIKDHTTICLITPGHISSNPRLIKEAITLRKAGYKTTVIYIETLAYLINHDKHIKEQNPEIVFISLNVSGNNLLSSLMKLFYLIISKLSVLGFLDENFRINRYYYWQLAKAIKVKSDLYVAHNLPSLPVAVNASRKNKSKCGFDAEDFHRYENSNDDMDKEVMFIKNVEDAYIPYLNYMTASSPLIATVYAKYYNQDVLNLLNVFPKIDRLNMKINESNTIRFFWFSQTIGKNRGLEEIIISLNNFQNVELHLLGELTSFNQKYFDAFTSENNISKKIIHYHKPIFAEEIFDFAQQFDVGLATETGIPLNRDICLTNKIFTYNQAGLAILASNTQAQSLLFKDYPKMGLLYNRNDNFDLNSKLKSLITKPSLLATFKAQSRTYALGNLNWETESAKFLYLIQKTLTP